MFSQFYIYAPRTQTSIKPNNDSTSTIGSLYIHLINETYSFITYSGADSIQIANGGDHRSLRKRVVGSRSPVCAIPKHGDALAGLFAQTWRSSSHTA